MRYIMRRPSAIVLPSASADENNSQLVPVAVPAPKAKPKAKGWPKNYAGKANTLVKAESFQIFFQVLLVPNSQKIDPKINEKLLKI